jgi:hypothetical protein
METKFFHLVGSQLYFLYSSKEVQDGNTGEYDEND